MAESNRSETAWMRIIGLLIIVCFALIGCKGHNIGMLNPQGIITYEERQLFFDTLALMLIVVLPVIVMSLTFVYHYRASHRLKEYKPNWSHSLFLESLWWGIPCVIIVILAVLTWKKTHQLDPYNKIMPDHHIPLQVQVIALPWKWLFIYPEQNIAAINFLMIPVGQEIEYWFTTDNVPMSAFFIPQIGSQIYTMAGMRTKLFLMANRIGTFDGMNTQYNGDGFSDMRFAVQVVEPEVMEAWFRQIKQLPDRLTPEKYNELLIPSNANKPQFFSGITPNLFNNVIALYMHSVGPLHPRHDIHDKKE
jgi:cytochrome o ubiquinol oxidase subunit 2